MINDFDDVQQVIDSIKTPRQAMIFLDKIYYARELAMLSKKEVEQIETMCAKKTYSFFKARIERC